MFRAKFASSSPLTWARMKVEEIINGKVWAREARRNEKDGNEDKRKGLKEIIASY